MSERPGTRRVDRATFTRTAAIALVPGLLSVLEMRPEAVSAKLPAVTQKQRMFAEKTIKDCLADLEKIKHIVDEHDRCPPWTVWHPGCPIFDDAINDLKKVLNSLQMYA